MIVFVAVNEIVVVVRESGIGKAKSKAIRNPKQEKRRC